MHLLFKKEMVRWRLFRSKLKNMSTKICTCTPGKSICDGNCLYGGGKLPNFTWVFFLIIAFLLAAVINSSAQVPAMYGGGNNVEEFLPETDLRTKRPIMWRYADHFEGADTYVVFKEAHQEQNQLYLVGLDTLGEQIMKLLIESAQVSQNFTYCIVVYSGWEIRLRGKL